MKKLRISALAVMLLTVAGGCSEAPTIATLSGSARLDGLGVGSGHVVPPPSATDAASDGTVTLAGDTASRGGLGVGSGHQATH